MPRERCAMPPPPNATQHGANWQARYCAAKVGRRHHQRRTERYKQARLSRTPLLLPTEGQCQWRCCYATRPVMGGVRRRAAAATVRRPSHRPSPTPRGMRASKFVRAVYGMSRRRMLRQVAALNSPRGSAAGGKRWQTGRSRSFTLHGVNRHARARRYRRPAQHSPRGIVNEPPDAEWLW